MERDDFPINSAFVSLEKKDQWGQTYPRCFFAPSFTSAKKYGREIHGDDLDRVLPVDKLLDFFLDAEAAASKAKKERAL